MSRTRRGLGAGSRAGSRARRREGPADCLGSLEEPCGGSGRLWSALGAPQLMLAVRTKPSSVLAERKLLMRLDGVCRHYLAMTKSALFLFAHGGKFNRGPQEKASLNRPSLLLFLRLAAAL